MLRNLARMVGVRLVMLAYLAGCLAPSAAMALGYSSAICLDELVAEVHAASAQSHAGAEHMHAHVHADGTVHYHADHAAPRLAGYSPQNDNGAPAHSHDDASCCGLFGFSAVLPQLAAPAPATIAHDLRPLFAADCLTGCSPDRIDRPPIASLPM